jgi:hypothetical protein
MRRRISLAIVMAAAVLAAIAAGGASSAAASEFCETNSGLSCTAPYSPGIILEMEQTSAQANFSPSPPGPGVSASCAHSIAKIEYVAPALRLEAEVLSFTFSSCTGGCTDVKASHLPWGAEAEARGGGSGTFNIFQTEGRIELIFSGCGEAGKTSCTYHQEQIQSSLIGGAPAVTKISSSLPLFKTGSGFCEKTIEWSPTAYKFSFPNPLYLR